MASFVKYKNIGNVKLTFPKVISGINILSQSRERIL